MTSKTGMSYVINTRYQQAKKVTIIGALINALLGLFKLLGGIFFHSHALVADGVHSFADLITDVMVIFASKYGGQPVDDSHPYGHQRIETAATLFLALLLIITGILIAFDSINDLLEKNHSIPQLLALPIALISILANEGLFHYTHHIGKKIQSTLIIANAWHHRSDALSSLIVLLGLVGSYFGFHYFDAIAAIIVGIMIVQMGWSYGWNSVKELVDTAIEPAILAQIEAAILQVDGVQKIHQLRSRSMGKDVFIDVHILVDPFISVSEGHYIAQHVHQHLIQEIDSIKDVTVHVDPEDDEETCPSIHLPNRTFLEQHLLRPWQEAYPEISYWTLHYLDGVIIIDLLVKDGFSHWTALNDKIRLDLQQQPNHIKIRCLTNSEIYSARV